MRLADTPFRIDSLDSHQPHQSLYPLSVNKVAFSLQSFSHSPGAIKWSLCVLFINEMHEWTQDCMDPQLVDNTLSSELFLIVQLVFLVVWSYFRGRYTKPSPSLINPNFFWASPVPPSTGQSGGTAPRLRGFCPHLFLFSIGEEFDYFLRCYLLPFLYLSGMNLVFTGQLSTRPFSPNCLWGYFSL